MNAPSNKPTFYCGDCLTVLKEHVADETIDLIYIDPPFNVGCTLRDINGSFHDKFVWDSDSKQTYEDLKSSQDITNKKLVSLLTFLLEIEQKSRASYLLYMAQRLVELHRCLKHTGSMYLHCDHRESHGIKFIMDIIFGKKNFINEIIWQRCLTVAVNVKRKCAVNDDRIFFYTKSTNYFYEQKRFPIKQSIEQAYPHIDEDGRRYVFYKKIRNPYGRKIKTRRFYADESRGAPLTTIWMGLCLPLGSINERVGYPTQKPLALLERIIQLSSKKGDTVLDPFCGSGTMCLAAQKYQRQAIGIDVLQNALDVATTRCDNVQINFL